MRDEMPLYRNERFDFFAVSRFADVEACSRDWQTFISGKGTVLEMIRAGVTAPRGMFIFEDPPIHDLHRGLMSRVFTPRRVAALEGRIREFCARALDPFVGSGGFDFVRDLGADMPMRVISEMLGIPESDQEAVRDQIDAGLRIDEDGRVAEASTRPPCSPTSAQFVEYINFRRRHPSDDLMTDLVTLTFVDETRRGAPSRRGGDRQLHDAAGRRGQRDHHPADRLDRLPARQAPRANASFC